MKWLFLLLLITSVYAVDLSKIDFSVKGSVVLHISDLKAWCKTRNLYKLRCRASLEEAFPSLLKSYEYTMLKDI